VERVSAFGGWGWPTGKGRRNLGATARPRSLESDGGIYDVLNRDSYRTVVFPGGVMPRAAFLQCLDEACGKTG
jgi:hypothetical protein